MVLPWIIGATIKNREKKSKRSKHPKNEKKSYDDLTEDDIEVLGDDLVCRVKMRNKKKHRFRKAQYEILHVCFL